MKDIKEKVRDQNPKIRNPASRLPKELVRSAMLETKEKSWGSPFPETRKESKKIDEQLHLSES